MRPICILSVLSLAVCCQYVSAYPNGAPGKSCESLKPGHGSQGSGDVYSLDIGAVTNYTSGVPVTVTIRGGAFQGLILQVRDKNGDATGTFTAPAAGSNLKLLTCGGVSGSAVTHDNTDPKTNSILTWNPPATYAGELYFVATVAEGKDKWWKDVQSAKFGTGDPASAGVSYMKTHGYAAFLVTAVLATLMGL